MKQANKNLVIVAIIAAVILIIASVICVFRANSMSANVASIIGGILSVAATTVLGLIALWQNRRYKELSDEKDGKLEQLTLTPECRLLSVSSVAKSNINQIAIPNATPTDKNLYLFFSSLNLPMIDITVQKITYSYYDKSNVKKTDTFQHDQLLFNFPRFTELENYSAFTIQTAIPHECALSEVVCEVICDIVLEYKNIYDMTFEKTFTIKRPKNSVNFTISAQHIAHRQGETQK